VVSDIPSSWAHRRFVSASIITGSVWRNSSHPGNTSNQGNTSNGTTAATAIHKQKIQSSIIKTI
jgi:hypothetical protein